MNNIFNKGDEDAPFPLPSRSKGAPRERRGVEPGDNAVPDAARTFHPRSKNVPERGCSEGVTKVMRRCSPYSPELHRVFTLITKGFLRVVDLKVALELL